MVLKNLNDVWGMIYFLSSPLHKKDRMNFRTNWFLITLIIITVLNPSNIFSKGQENIKYKYSIKARCIPEKKIIEGKYRAIIPAADSAMTRKLEIFAPEKPEKDRTYYILPSVDYNHDPIRYKSNQMWIEIKSIIVNGEKINLSDIKQKNKIITIEFENPKALHSNLEIEVDYVTHQKKEMNDLILPPLWFPMIAPPEKYRKGYSLPGIFEYEITLPSEYSLISSGIVVDTLSTGNKIKYFVHDSNIHFPIWIAGKDFKLESSCNHPVNYSIWSAFGDYPEGTVERIEEQILKLYNLFGEPVGDKQDLNIVLSPSFFTFQTGSVFGSNWGNMVIINKFFFDKSFFRHSFPELIGHELLHYWWINRIFGNYSGEDHLFHECLVEHMTLFYDELIVRDEPSSLISKIARKIGKTSNKHTLINARSGYHYSVLNDTLNAGYMEKIEKGVSILQTVSGLYPREAWNKKIIDYFESIRNGNPPTFIKFCELNPDIAPVLKIWFEENVDFDYAIEKVINRKDKDNNVVSGAIISNKCGIHLPVPVKFEYENGTTYLDTTFSRCQHDTILRISKSDLKRVILDPEYTFPDYNRSNNRNFTKIGIGFMPNSYDMKEDYMIHTVPFPVPDYSELTGWSLGIMPISIRGVKEKDWIAEVEKQMHISPVIGYNFKTDEVIWGAEYNQPLNFPTEYSALNLMSVDNPEFRRHSIEFKSNIVKNRFEPPLQIISAGGRYYDLYKPAYRDIENWTIGENIILKNGYEYKNINSFSYPAEGYRITLNAHKSFPSLGSDWNYEYLSTSVEYYSVLPLLTVFATRITAGNIWGYAPYQMRFDLVSNALFSTHQRYEYTGQRMFSSNFELRFRKRIPFLDFVVYSRNAWIRDYHARDYLRGHEIGLGFCNTKYLLNFDFTLWRKIPGMDAESMFGFQFSFGRRFDYTDRRWHSK